MNRGRKKEVRGTKVREFHISYFLPLTSYFLPPTSFLVTFGGVLKMIFLIGGIVSPNKNPQGFSGSMRSKITFTIAVSGIDKNIPATPQRAPPISTTTIDTRALMRTLEATILGTI